MRCLFSTGLIAGALLAIAGCGADRLNVPNYQNPTTGSITSDPVAAIPLLATGVLRDDRGNFTGYVSGTGILGRESYNYTATEGRNTSGWLTSDVENGTSFGGGALWSPPFFTLRDAFNTATVVDAASESQVSATQKSAVHGFLHTMEALSLLYLINTRDSLGAVVEVTADPTKLEPFVSRDSVFNRIIGRLDQAATELRSGGASFPFTFHSGYTGFTTPTTYLKFNRALAARVNAYRASLGIAGCGAKFSPACYQTVLQNLSESFLDPSGSLSGGVYNVYSSAANDASNSLSNSATTNIVAHFRADSGIELRPDGSKDLRFTTKVFTLAKAKSPPSTVDAQPTKFDYKMYDSRSDPIPIIKNEELLLLRAEARYFTGDQAGALADINLIRTQSGGLAPRGAFASDSDFVDELLYNRRLSLLFEGHRWVDMRRFQRLDQLTIDKPSHVVVDHLPIPQAECLSRANASGDLKAPGC
ncbi:MAG TPA: RagB/SusD family nutrient uptake outer membrane protein [Gemmatimonadaceae bacterium]|nr:RagB/SusD family nutrient uptake outer membrane protein [Gemmatimonadaceae bacterium]